MAIKKIKITNFKSFKELEVDLNKFNILIGANASGKSNFIHIFEFLRDITNHGLDNALSMQGDIEYFRNINIGSSKSFSLEVISDQEFRGVVREKIGEKRVIGMKTYETIYKFALGFYKQKAGFKIVKDKLRLKCKFVRLEKKKKGVEEEELGTGEISFTNVNGKIRYELNPPEGVLTEKEDLLSLSLIELIEERLSPKTLLLETPLFFVPLRVSTLFKDISIYNFDPKLPKKAVPISGKTELEEDGSNLAIVLKNIIEDKNKKRKFSNLIKDILSFVDDLGVEKFADKSLLVKLRETYFQEKFLPAFLISDGTMNITALIIALYFERKPLVIIEEPERNIHPYLISKVVDMMKDVSKEKQIILTTHNPEMVKHAGLENILFVSRDEEGFSKISKPSDNEEVKTFLENEIGIDELYVQNLLGL